MKRVLLLGFGLLSFSAFSMEGLMTKDFWIKQMPPGSEVTAAFGEVHNHTTKDKVLVSVEGDIAESIEVHTHVKENGVMKMRKVEFFKIAPHGSLILKPGGDHIMFFGLKKTLKESNPIELTLVFKDGEKKKIKLKVLKNAPEKEEHKHHHSKH